MNNVPRYFSRKYLALTGVRLQAPYGSFHFMCVHSLLIFIISMLLSLKFSYIVDCVHENILISGYVVHPNYFASSLKKLPMFYDKEFVEDNQSRQSSEEIPSSYREFPELVMP